jgi:phenylpropionate dioxygenase-like ring-hydroxylating dioxygenase large terminal subunit
MFKNFWYAVCQSGAVSKRPLLIKLFGIEIVIFRNGQGDLAALESVCPHRGASLSLGEVRKDCLRCSYHGWSFDAHGICNDIPANRAASAGNRFNTGYLPVQERYGHVFVYIGEGEPESGFSLPDVPEFDQLQNWGVIFGESSWQTHPTRSIENLLDFSHTAVVHKSFGNPEHPEIDPYQVSRTETSVSATVAFCPPMNLVQWILRNGKMSEVLSRATFYMPNITRLDIRIGKWQMIVLAFHHQIDDKTTIMHWVQLRDFFKSPIFDWDARRRIAEVIEEDRPIVESQRPFVVPLDLAAEKHVPSDALHVAFRLMVGHFIDSGYGLKEPLTFRRESGKSQT